MKSLVMACGVTDDSYDQILNFQPGKQTHFNLQ